MATIEQPEDRAAILRTRLMVDQFERAVRALPAYAQDVYEWSKGVGRDLLQTLTSEGDDSTASLYVHQAINSFAAADMIHLVASKMDTKQAQIAREHLIASWLRVPINVAEHVYPVLAEAGIATSFPDFMHTYIDAKWDGKKQTYTMRDLIHQMISRFQGKLQGMRGYSEKKALKESPELGVEDYLVVGAFLRQQILQAHAEPTFIHMGTSHLVESIFLHVRPMVQMALAKEKSFAVFPRAGKRPTEEEKRHTQERNRIMLHLFSSLGEITSQVLPDTDDPRHEVARRLIETCHVYPWFSHMIAVHVAKLDAMMTLDLPTWVRDMEEATLDEDDPWYQDLAHAVLDTEGMEHLHFLNARETEEALGMPRDQAARVFADIGTFAGQISQGVGENIVLKMNREHMDPRMLPDGVAMDRLEVWLEYGSPTIYVTCFQHIEGRKAAKKLAGYVIPALGSVVFNTIETPDDQAGYALAELVRAVLANAAGHEWGEPEPPEPSSLPLPPHGGIFQYETKKRGPRQQEPGEGKRGKGSKAEEQSVSSVGNSPKEASGQYLLVRDTDAFASLPPLVAAELIAAEKKYVEGKGRNKILRHLRTKEGNHILSIGVQGKQIKWRALYEVLEADGTAHFIKAYPRDKQKRRNALAEFVTR